MERLVNYGNAVSYFLAFYFIRFSKCLPKGEADKTEFVRYYVSLQLKLEEEANNIVEGKKAVYQKFYLAEEMCLQFRREAAGFILTFDFEDTETAKKYEDFLVDNLKKHGGRLLMDNLGVGESSEIAIFLQMLEDSEITPQKGKVTIKLPDPMTLTSKVLQFFSPKQIEA